MDQLAWANTYSSLSSKKQVESVIPSLGTPLFLNGTTTRQSSFGGSCHGRGRNVQQWRHHHRRPCLHWKSIGRNAVRTYRATRAHRSQGVLSTWAELRLPVPSRNHWNNGNNWKGRTWSQALSVVVPRRFPPGERWGGKGHRGQRQLEH